jgi:excisionase family DNA binding protein
MVDEQMRRKLVGEGLDRVMEAAAFLKMSKSSIYNLMENGQLPFVRIGRARRIPHQALVELAARNLSGPSQ